MYFLPLTKVLLSASPNVARFCKDVGKKKRLWPQPSCKDTELASFSTLSLARLHQRDTSYCSELLHMCDSLWLGFR